MSAMFAAALMFTAQAAPSAADIADAKCVGALTMLAEQAEAGDKDGVQASVLFFLGKIYGRSGAASVKPAMEAAVQTIDRGEAAIAAMGESCANQVGAAVDEM